MSNSNRRTLPYHAGLMLYVILWASRNVFSASILRTYDPLVFTFIVAVFAAGYALLFRLIFVGTKITYNFRQAIPSFIILGIATSVALIGTNLSLALLSPVLWSLIDVSIYPILASLMAYLFARGEEINLRIIFLVLVLAVAGILMFSMQSVDAGLAAISIPGLIFAVLAELGWATSIVTVANLVRNGTPVLDIISFRFLMSILVLGLFLILTPGSLVLGDQLGAVALIAFGGYLIPFILSFSSLKRLSVTTFAIYTMLTPVATYILAAVILGEWQLNSIQILGAALVFISLIIRIVTERRPAAPQAS
jgi:drug/metabolite transporter (DMT)-like permease